ncbi:vWA domain-containing protein [Spiribacter vilamensis]|nr:vWA domain-containing protein [Spiribacter vilamensis]
MFPVGTTVSPTGIASGTGSGGSGLDLGIVMDSSGSMGAFETVGNTTQTRREWQQQFARDLVSGLPTTNTSVGIVEFDSSASTVQSLTPLSSPGNISLINSAIDSVDASGLTDIGDGITEAEAILTGVDATVGRSQQMVVFSDGESQSGPAEADIANSNGISVNSVALPGANVGTMQDLADGPDGIVGNSDDNGTFTDGTDLQALLDIFSGTTGNLVGLERVDITLPDGTIQGDVATDAIGGFTSPGYSLGLGSNIFIAQAFGTDGSTAIAELDLIGVADGGPTPVPAPGALALLVGGLFGTLAGRRRMKQAS